MIKKYKTIDICVRHVQEYARYASMDKQNPTIRYIKNVYLFWKLKKRIKESSYLCKQRTTKARQLVKETLIANKTVIPNTAT